MRVIASLPEAARVSWRGISAKTSADGVADVRLIVGDKDVRVADDRIFGSFDIAGAQDGIGPSAAAADFCG